LASAIAQASGDAGETAASLLDSLVAGQARAIECVAKERAALADAARLVAGALRSGGRLLYIGAGSSGLLAMQDGLELPGTFGLDAERIRFVAPNGERFSVDASGEDDESTAEEAVDALSPCPNDVAIAVSASGLTPFTLAGARRVKAARAGLVVIVCRGSSPLAALADAAVEFEVGCEAVEGSTRLAAGTAQKAALGVISTLAAAELGWVYDGLMVNLRPDNAKLRARAESIVARMAAVGEVAASAALAEALNDVPVAIAAAAGRLDATEARALVAECGGDLSRILARVKDAAANASLQRGHEARRIRRVG
jgi:N-acetylmuramic acid 6-phosphate etherase